MSAVYVIGTGCTPFGRHHDLSIKALARWAIGLAIGDAGIEAGAIGAAFFANSTQAHFDGQHSLRGPIVVRGAGLERLFVTSVENACAGGLTAFALAVQAVRAGACDVALAVGAEKLADPDKAKSFSAFESGVDLSAPDEVARGLADLRGGDAAVWEGASPPRSRMMDIYAAIAEFHMRTFGTRVEHFAAVASKNRFYGARNPLAAIKAELSPMEILEARRVVGPLTVPMCAPVCDGAAAILIAGEAFATKVGKREVSVRAAQVMTGEARRADDYDRHVARMTARRAYEEAGLGPQDVDVAEVHDATCVGEILQTELMGFCELGDGGAFATTGATRLDGAIPVNLSGGLESKGHPVGATGLSQIGELAAQLRGRAGERQADNPRIGLAENGGGFLGVEEAVCGVAILEAVRPR